MQRTKERMLFGLILSIIFLVATSIAWASNGFAEIEISVKGTYLLADPDQSTQDPSSIAAPGIVDLQNNGISSGDTILITFEGSINVYGQSDYAAINSLIGVFSSNNQLLPISEADRVPGAIDAGDDVNTGQTFFTHENTDIPEDFQITNSTGFSIEVPQNAKYLFISYSDSYYADNISPNPIGVSIEKQTREPTGGFPIEYILAAVGAIAVIAVLLFLMLKRRKSETQSTHGGGGTPTAPASSHGGGEPT